MDGQIFSGFFSNEDQSFILTQVKNLSTQSVMSAVHLENLYHYLKAHEKDDDPVTITVNDQLPLLLNHDDKVKLLEEIEELLIKFH